MGNIDELKNTGLKATLPRLKILEIFQTGSQRHMTAEDVFRVLLNERSDIGLATVYRALQALAADGDVDVLRTGEGEAVYRRCSDTHHHHLVCRPCGATVEVEGPAVERWTSAIAGEHGYADISHTLEIFGTCPACR